MIKVLSITTNWNYRIIDFGDHKALHEVYYDAEGTPNSWTEEPASFVCDDDESHTSITDALAMAIHDAARAPVLKHLNGKLVSADVIRRDEITTAIVDEAVMRRVLKPARDIALKVRKEMMSRMDDDVIGAIRESHIAFGTACAHEALAAK